MINSDLPVLGIDPGARWTAGVLRVGSTAVTGWTLGPTTADGRRDPAALDDPDDLEALARYVARVLERVDRTYEMAEREVGPCRVAVEAIHVPVSHRHGKRSRISLVDWLTPRSVVVAVLTAYDAVLIPPAGHGRGPLESYPAVLRRKRPEGWINEAPRGERDHERAAWDVAGAGALASMAKGA